VTTKDVVKAEIVMDDGKKIPLKIDGRKLQANLVLFQAQSYRILVEDTHGFRNTPISYELRVKPDGFPTVDLLRPTEDLEINGDETLSLEYSARDDFGISEIALITKIGDREEKISLQKEEAKRLIVRDQYTWDLGKLGLRDGEEAVFFLQVFDNDTISGPKIGTSRSIRLKLKNLKGEHQQVADMIRDCRRRNGIVGDLERQPVAHRGLGIETHAKKQRGASHLRTDAALQHPRRAAAGMDAQLLESRVEQCRRTGDPDVGGQRQIQPGADRRAVHCRDCGQRTVGDREEAVVDAAQAVLGGGAERGQVGACAERLACASHDECVHIGVGFGGVDGRAQSRRDFRGYGVAAFWVVDRDEGDVIVDLDQYWIGHRLSLVTGCCRERWR